MNDNIPSTSTINPETNKAELINIVNNVESGEILIQYENLNLNSEQPDSQEVEIQVERLPTLLADGSSYFNVLIDEGAPGLDSLKSQAEQLKEFPEEVRAVALQRITKGAITFATDEVIERVAQTDPDLAKWVSANTGLDSGFTDVKLSEVQESGYGVCRHMAVFYLWLAQHAGMRGVLAEAPQSSIRNVRKPDGETLFKSVEEGELVKSGHAWTELYLTDGRITPVDPSKNLIGNTPESLAIFREANYRSIESGLLNIGVQPGDQLTNKGKSPSFDVGERFSSIKISAHLRSTDPISVLDFETFTWKDEAGSNISYNGDAEIKVSSNILPNHNNQTAILRPINAKAM